MATISAVIEIAADARDPSQDFEEAIIGPAPGWSIVPLGELWRFRELLYFLAWRDVKVRYKQTLLGMAWAVLQPALLMWLFTAFLGRTMTPPSGGYPYALFVYAGLLPWTLFATSISAAGNSLIGSESLITKVYFPRLLIPLAAVVPAVADFAVAACLLLGLMLWYGFLPGWSWLFIPIATGLIGLTALAAGILLAAVNVRYRDFRYVLPFLIQAWMFATPSIYLSAAPTESWLAFLNPVNGTIDFFRASALGGDLPWGSLVSSAAVAGVGLVAACWYFSRVEDSFADVI